jgi:hypothetical protein
MLRLGVMTDLDDTYQRLARRWTHEQLAARYRDVEHRGAAADDARPDVASRPIALVAAAIPPAAAMSVAVHVLHVLPGGARGGAFEGLTVTAENSAAGALHQAHRALELDGQRQGYTTGEWLPTIYDIAAGLLESARANDDPPTLVGAAQDSISWLSQAVLELDQGSPEAPGTLAEALARLLTVSAFAVEAGGPQRASE